MAAGAVGKRESREGNDDLRLTSIAYELQVPGDVKVASGPRPRWSTCGSIYRYLPAEVTAAMPTQAAPSRFASRESP